MIYDIIRFCEQGKFESKLIDQFGNDEFKQVKIIENAEEKQAYTINLYCENLKKIASADYVMPFRVNTFWPKNQTEVLFNSCFKESESFKGYERYNGKDSVMSISV